MSARKSLVVIGNGMAGARLCRRLVELKGIDRYDVTVFGEEKRPAYDRTRLSELTSHRDATRLELMPPDWYETHGIALRLGDPVTSIDRRARTVVSQSGTSRRYDVLVFATGSNPFLPSIAGIDAQGVFPYRTVDDVERLVTYAKGLPKKRRVAIVLGGGILGLEAARAVQSLGLDVRIVQLGPYLMPAQLDAEAAAVLQRWVERQGIRVQVGTEATGIVRDRDRLRLALKGAGTVTADVVVVAAGIRPCTSLAAEAGFRCAPEGGIRVDDHLRVEEDVYAIGECALHRRRIYGLMAPAYRMADAVAARLCGASAQPFRGGDLSTQLKMLGVDVVSFGSGLKGPGERCVAQGQDTYRCLIFQRDRLVGAAAVGPWPEAPQVQAAVNARTKIGRKQRQRFAETGAFTGLGPAHVASWPDDATVCNCLGVKKGTLQRVLASHAADADMLARLTGASTGCGACRPLLEELSGTPATRETPRSDRTFAAASMAALVFALFAAFAPGAPMADSVQSWWHQVDALWRVEALKKLTGFTLAGGSAVALLLPVRKRLRLFSFVRYANVRTLHGLVGALVLLVLFLHTGFRLGSGLNAWLMIAFVGLNLFGAALGVSSTFARGGTSTGRLARALRPSLATLHLVMFWPFPVLLVLHVLSVYFF